MGTKSQESSNNNSDIQLMEKNENTQRVVLPVTGLILFMFSFLTEIPVMLFGQNLRGE
jgi:hypothetical protein